MFFIYLEINIISKLTLQMMSCVPSPAMETERSLENPRGLDQAILFLVSVLSSSNGCSGEKRHIPVAGQDFQQMYFYAFVVHAFYLCLWIKGKDEIIIWGVKVLNSSGALLFLYFPPQALRSFCWCLYCFILCHFSHISQLCPVKSNHKKSLYSTCTAQSTDKLRR